MSESFAAAPDNPIAVDGPAAVAPAPTIGKESETVTAEESARAESPNGGLGVRIVETGKGELVVRLADKSGQWWSDPAVWSPFLALLIAAGGWYQASAHLNRQLEQTTRNMKEQLDAERQRLNRELEEERELKRQEFARQRTRERAELVRSKLDSFYYPYKQLSDTNRLLHQSLKARQPNPDKFRTLTSLLEGHEFSKDDQSLICELVKIGAQLEVLLASRSGLVDDSELRSIFATAATHFRILRMASEGALRGDSERFAEKVYPRELDERLDAQIAALVEQLRVLEAEMA